MGWIIAYGRRVCRVVVVAVMSVISFADIYSQEEISVPYICGFEDSVENSNWILNSSRGMKQSLDRWMVGNLDCYEGHNSLYISCDGGRNIQFGAEPDVVVAYRAFRFTVNGSYDVSFNWKGNGIPGKSGLYVCLLTDANDSVSVPDKATLPSWVNMTALRFDGQQMLYGTTSWQTASFKLNVKAGRRFKIAFVWQNSNTDTAYFNPQSICIDNIQITSTNCLKPTDLETKAECDTIWASWEGVSEKYECQYRLRGSIFWHNAEVEKNLNSLRSSVIVTGIQEGAYDLRVRGICAADTSAWVSANSILVFCPENHCVNYVTLENAVCEIGMASDPNSFKQVAPVDNGCDDKFSRHTVCWTQDQYDPRTNNRLRMIPDGEFASVRLGNWNNGGESERISYTYTIDSANASILLLKYAIVLQDPSHGKEEQPRFKLEILDENGDLVDPTCGEVNFEADINRPGWHPVGENLVWKDWTVMGLNLGQYDGRTLVIRLSTFDCTLKEHYGYAYFTLDCTSGQIKGNSCGDMPEISLSAPDGFVYNWFNPDIPEFHEYQKTITVPSNDPTTYYCDCGSTENSECSFQLKTKILPRFPKAGCDYRIEHKNCQTKIYFENKSVVLSRFNGRDTVLHNETCETYLWEIDSSSYKTTQTDPVYAVPNEGGKIHVRLTAGISDNRCTDIYEFEVDVPSIYEHKQMFDENMCFGESRIFGKNFIMASGEFSDTTQNVWGCDSITVLNMEVWPEVKDSIVTDTICFGEEYMFNDSVYSRTGDYDVWLKNEHGCDSVVTLKLYVYPEVRFTYRQEDVLNLPKSGSITIIPDPALGDNYTYTVNGVSEGELTGLDGGEYEITVYNEYNCPSDTVVIVLYSECLDVEFGSIENVCSGDPFLLLPYTLNAGVVSEYSVKYDSIAVNDVGFQPIAGASLLENESYIALPVPDNCCPGHYVADIVFHDILCDDLKFEVPFSVYYDSAIVVQKWNDVLAILNESYNGGYEFDEYQWYKNDNIINGANGHYFYLKEGEFEAGDSYFVELRRVNDGVSVPTCPVMPVFREPVSDYIKVVSAKEAATRVFVNVPEDGVTVNVYTSVGALVSSANCFMGETEIDMPSVPGIYIVYVYNEYFTYVEKIILY